MLISLEVRLSKLDASGSVQPQASLGPQRRHCPSCVTPVEWQRNPDEQWTLLLTEQKLHCPEDAAPADGVVRLELRGQAWQPALPKLPLTFVNRPDGQVLHGVSTLASSSTLPAAHDSQELPLTKFQSVPFEQQPAALRPVLPLSEGTLPFAPLGSVQGLEVQGARQIFQGTPCPASWSLEEASHTIVSPFTCSTFVGAEPRKPPPVLYLPYMILLIVR